MSNHQQDGHQYLHLFLKPNWSVVQETTGQTPAAVLFGSEILLPCDLQIGFKPTEKKWLAVSTLRLFLRSRSSFTKMFLVISR